MAPIGASPSSEEDSPTLVFLHEGLGSISQWRDFPQVLCNATGLRGLVYARQGYGQSSPRAQPADTNFMHIEAQQVLPALLESLSIEHPILVGHSDGASIALLYSAWARRHALRAPCVALCVLAPHLFVEDEGLVSIAQARQLFNENPGFRERLGKHHRDAEQTFKHWSHVWLSEDFKAWNIEHELADISCPILAIQGCDDQYGSLAHIRRIPELVRDASRVELVEIADCRHSPHLEKQAEVLSACLGFIGRHLP